MESCQNCSNAIAGNFCDSCGQKKFKRIDKKYIWDELQYTFVHTNKGFLYSIKNILKNPGKTAREFIEGNRVNHYKPINLLVLLVGASSFLSTHFIGLEEIYEKYYFEIGQNTKLQKEFLSYCFAYPQVFMVLMIPFFALLTRIVFRKKGNNFYEHFVINAFMLNFYSLLSLLFLYPLIFLFRNTVPSTVLGIMYLQYLFLPFMFYYFFKEFYPTETKKRIIIKVFQLVGISLLAFFLLMFLAVLIGVVLAMILSPQTMQGLVK